MRSEFKDKIISTVKVDDKYEIAINFCNNSEWHILGIYDYKNAIIKHKKLEQLSREKIMFQFKYNF